jgi:fumarate hydratase subunit beta
LRRQSRRSKRNTYWEAGEGEGRAVQRGERDRGTALIATAEDGIKEVSPPLTDADIESLVAGHRVRISGVIYTARDAAHGRLLPLAESGQPLPIDVRGQIIYYTGPSPARPGAVVGSIGPTTGGRMDRFTPALLRLGLKGTIGKGARSQAVKDALRQYRAVYFGAIGGAGAVLSEFVKRLDIVAYEDLGTEAIRRLEVESFPAIVINDCHGGDLYQDGVKEYARP